MALSRFRKGTKGLQGRLNGELVNCQATPGQRCLELVNEQAFPDCVPMSCSAAGEVLVNGVPCDPSACCCCCFLHDTPI